MDRLDAMAALVAAVDGGSLSAASRALGMPLATVSRKVSDLEAHLGAQLIVRTSRKLVLTEAGRTYVAASRRILDEIGDAERAARGEYQAPRGHLTVTAPVLFGRLHVQPVLLDFLKAYPDIDARLVLADPVVNLIDDRVDVAVRIGTLADSGMAATRLGEVRRVTCAGPGYLSARGTPETPGALAGHDCILFEGHYSSGRWRFGRGQDTVTVTVRPRLAVNSADAAIAAAVASAGITRVLSYQAAASVASGALRLVLRPFEPDPLPVHLVFGGGAPLPLKLRAFLDFAAPRLKASIPERHD
jgi:DNA-binding transcriptional LysR family regulator